MIIGKKKYIFSKGLAFYSEMESTRLEEELASGWLIEGINYLGFYKLKRAEKEQAQIVIDFYTGKKNDLDEYLELYEVAGWEKVICYRNRYFIFKADEGAEAVYTDEESYATRLNKERLWLMLNSLYFFLFGLIGLFLLSQPVVREVLLNIKVVYYSFALISEICLIAPLIVFALVTYYKFIYLKRTRYFKKPEQFAKRQHFVFDMLMAALIGAILGGIIGFLTSYFNLF